MMNKHYAYWYAVVAGIALLAAFVPMVVSGRASASTVIVVLIVTLILPALLIWVMQRMGYPIGQPVSCPNCGTEMPLFRKPASVRQGLLGGYTCPKCGTQMDAKGRALR